MRKLLWLQGRDRQVAYVGSHNLTAAGYNDQWECTNRLDSRDPGHVAALRDIHAVVSRLVPRTLEKIWTHTTPPVANDAVARVRFLSSLDEPLLDQLLEHIGDTHYLRVVTPFVDPVALEALVTPSSAQNIVLDVPADGTDIPVDHAVAGLSNVVVRQAKRKQKDQRHVHAKIYEAVSDGVASVALGSANCTQAALLCSVLQGGNLEFITVDRTSGLPEGEGPIFEEVADLTTVPAAGRSWDSDRATKASLEIESAEWRDASLEVRWREYDRQSGDVVLVVGDKRFMCGTSPFSVALDDEPKSVGLARGWDAAPVARAWVVYPDVLEVQVHRRLQQRWVEHLESDDPRSYAAGFDRIFDNMARAVRGLIEADEASSDETGAGLYGAPKPRSVREAVETFAFSPDPVEIHKTAAELIGSPGGDNPFLILRALLARHGAPAPAYLQDDADGLERHERQRQYASRRISEHLLRYLRQLCAEEIDWAGTSPKRARRC